MQVSVSSEVFHTFSAQVSIEPPRVDGGGWVQSELSVGQTLSLEEEQTDIPATSFAPASF